MLQTALHWLLVGALASPALAQSVHIGGPGREWREAESAREGGAVTIIVRPSDTAAGRALLVIDKPEWMTLADDEPPRIESATVGEQAAGVGESLSIAAAGAASPLKLQFVDDANPIAGQSVALVADGQRIPPASLTVDGHRASATFDLTALGAGAYAGHIEVTDRSPAANALHVPFYLTVDGVRRHPDGQGVTVCCKGSEFVVRGGARTKGFLELGDTGASAYLTSQVGGQNLWANAVLEITDLPDGEGVRVLMDVSDVDGADVGRPAALEFDLEPAPDLPGLLVTSRARNLLENGPVYCFWGWLPGEGYVTSEGEHAWSMTYSAIGSVGWVFLPSLRADGTGIGMLSPLVFGESRFGTMLLYTDPQRIETPQGGEVEMKLALMLADSADQVSDAQAYLAGETWWQTE